MEETPASRARAEVRRVRERSTAVGNWKRIVFVFGCAVSCWLKVGERIMEVRSGQQIDKRLDQCFEEGRTRMEPFRLPVAFIERRLVGVPNGKQDAGGSGVGATRKRFHLRSHFLFSLSDNLAALSVP